MHINMHIILNNLILNNLKKVKNEELNSDIKNWNLEKLSSSVRISQ